MPSGFPGLVDCSTRQVMFQSHMPEGLVHRTCSLSKDMAPVLELSKLLKHLFLLLKAFLWFLSACSHSILPEYALPCVIHMLAHHPDFKQDDHETLVQFRE